MNSIREFFKIIVHIYEILTQKQKLQSIGVFFVMFFSSMLELISVSSFIPFFYAMLNPFAVLENRYVKFFLDYFNLTGLIKIDNIFTYMGIALAVVFIIRTVLLLVSNYVTLAFQNRIFKDSTVLMLKSYLSRPYIDMININSSEAMKDINNTTSIYYILQSFFNIIKDAVLVISLVILLLNVNFNMTLHIFTIIIVVSVLVLLLTKKTVFKSGVLFNESMAMVTKYSYEALNGIKEINVNDRNLSFINRFEFASEKKRKAELNFRFLQIFPNIVIECIFFVVLILYLSFELKSGTDASILIPQLATFAYAAIRIITNISSMVSLFSSVIYYKASFDCAYNAIKTARIYIRQMELAQISDISTEKLLSFNTIQIKNLFWKYPDAKKIVLENVSLTISKGESIGFIGPSGSGKSTLADIILGILQPQRPDTVVVDGIDIFTVKKQWAKTVGYIPQSVFLLDDTIRNNILFGLNSENIDDEKIWQALDNAQLKNFVMDLPDGLDTVVGERGIKFSGGQRQRIAIARALFNDPLFLVLDEATSALDNDTEKAVMDAIEYLHGKVTLLIIAHRLSTIENCDKVYKIENKTIKREK